MLVLALVPPAVVQPPVAAPRSFGALVEGLEGIAEAYITGNEAELPGRLGAARKLWEHARRTHAPVLTEQELQFLERSFDAMPSLRPRAMAEAALGVAAVIAGRMRPSQNGAFLKADLVTMLAWCRVEARAWDQIPNLTEAFQPLLDHCSSKRTSEKRLLMDYLGALQVDLARRSVSGAKRDLRRLLDLIDVLEKP